MSVATASEVAHALCEALGIEKVEDMRCIRLNVEAGEAPTVTIVRYINGGEVCEVRQVLSAFKASEPL